MKERLRVIVHGLIAQYPLGGMTWHYLQYVLGLHRLGHDVYYIEDTGAWPYNPVEGGLGADCAYNVAYLDRVMARYGLGQRWAYCFPKQRQWFGMTDGRRREVVATADLLVNVSGSLGHPQDYRSVKRLVWIDSDPVFAQLKLANRQTDFCRLVDAHDVHFSFGERLGPALTRTPHRWIPTRQPVVLAEWRPERPARDVWTTVMNWTSYRSVSFEGRTYGQKDVEFQRFLDLPARVAPLRLELAVSAGKTRHTPRDLLRHRGWLVVDPDRVTATDVCYRDYIESSRGEWSVAKNAYVVGRCAWFSERSACYLAAGRPVVVQDTGFSSVLPVGEGLLAFSTPDEAAAALAAVESDYPRHARAARAVAEACFASDQVLGRLIEEAFAGRAVAPAPDPAPSSTRAGDAV